MRYGVITIGSRGDVEPFIALGRRLKERGHSVRIAAFCKFEQYIKDEGFEFSPLTGDAVELMQLLIGENVNSFQYFKNLNKLLKPIKKEFLQDIENACAGMDAILYSVLGSIAYHVVERMKIPCFRVFFCPLDPTGEFPTMTAPELPFGAVYNKLTFKCGDWLWTHFTRKNLNIWRKSMEIKGIKRFSFPYREMFGKPIHTLYAYSEIVAPKPSEWDEAKHLTGYWICDLKQEFVRNHALEDFINRGSKPIYIGFGSTVGGSFDEALNIVIESLKITNQRAVLSSGWGNLAGKDLPETIYQIENIPHQWLFPQMAGVVHHGGAGTTVAGLRAGVPTTIVAFGGDQPYWGKRVNKLGVGPKPILRKNLNVRNLSSAILEMVSNQAMIEKSNEIGQKLCTEDGVENAVRIIEGYT